MFTTFMEFMIIKNTLFSIDFLQKVWKICVVKENLVLYNMSREI